MNSCHTKVIKVESGNIFLAIKPKVSMTIEGRIGLYQNLNVLYYLGHGQERGKGVDRMGENTFKSYISLVICYQMYNLQWQLKSKMVVHL